MTRLFTILAMLLISIALVVEVRFRLSEAKQLGSDESDKTSGDEAATWKSGSTRSNPFSSQDVASGPRRTEEVSSPTTKKSSNGELATSSVGNSGVNPGEQASSLVVGSHPVTSTTVVGRDFPMSPSVRTYCAVDVDCLINLLPLLDEFAQQDRAEPWARLTEEMIRDVIVHREPTHFSIRTIECRTSLCVVEVDSPDQHFYPKYILYGGPPLRLHPVELESAPEKVAPSGGVIVSLVVMRPL